MRRYDHPTFSETSLRPGREDPAVAWLLGCDEPALRMLTLTEVLGLPDDHPEVLTERAAFASGPIVRTLLDSRGEGVYHKWQGPFWRLTALLDLGLPAAHPQANAYLEAVLVWLHQMEQRGYPPVIGGRPRAHAVWQGHALAAAVAVNWPDKEHVAGLVERLLEWQWPDGGWNCDRHKSPACSSVHETLGPLWGLAGYHRVSGDSAVLQAINRAAEFLLERRLFKSRRTGEIIDPLWLQLRQPAYYHYNVLQALWVLRQAGFAGDHRVQDAVQLVAGRRRPDGRWNANGRWWRPPGLPGAHVEAVDWGPSVPNLLVTLKALTVTRTKQAV